MKQGRVRLEDRLGNIEPDAAADLGRRHQTEVVMDVRRALLNARELWYLIVLQLHRFIVAVSRVSVHHDGRGRSAPDPLVWDQRGVDVRVMGPGFRFRVGAFPVLMLLPGLAHRSELLMVSIGARSQGRQGSTGGGCVHPTQRDPP